MITDHESETGLLLRTDDFMDLRIRLFRGIGTDRGAFNIKRSDKAPIGWCIVTVRISETGMVSREE